MDDAELIAKVRAGDQHAERVLYDGHVDRVYRLAYRMTGDDDLARDLTQETFVRVFDRLEQFRGEAALSTWIRAIAATVILNGLRKVTRFRRREVALDEARDVAGGPVKAEPDLREHLSRAIDDLPVKYRMVVVMHDIEGYTHEEIAAAMNSQPGTSKAQLSRARARLRETLAPYAGEWAS